MKPVYEKISEVLRQRTKLNTVALAAHEFAMVNVACRENDGGPEYYILAREYVGVTESTLARRLREMRQMGMVTAKRREGKAFVEYSLVEQPA